MGNNKNSLAIAFGVAAVWFGAHVGGGFATGNQTVQYFVKFGWTAAIVPVFVMALLAWIYYQAVLIAKNHDVHSYDKMAEKLYEPYGRIGKVIFDIGYLVLTLVGVGIAIAGSGELFKDVFGLNYYIGIILTGFIFFLLTIFGAKLVRNASSAITLLILICLVVLLIPGIRSGSENLSRIFAEKTVNGSFGQVLWHALLYAGFQSLVAGSLVSASQTLTDKSLCKKFAVVGFVLNAVMTVLCAIMILGYMPEVAVNKLPILTIAKSQGLALLTTAYSCILFLAFVSTGVGVVFGFVARYENAILKSTSLSIRRAVISAIVIILSTTMAVTGITKLVAVGYGWLGRFCIFVVILPLAIIAPIKNAKFAKEHPEVE